MGGVFKIFLWLSAVYSAMTTPPTHHLDNTTVPQTHADKEPLVDVYQTLRNIISKQLSKNYPVPPKFYSTAYNIYASFEPLQIITLDEVLQSISMSSAITLAWIDPAVAWDPQDYQGIQVIKLPASLFWLPDIIIPETSVEDGQITIPNLVDVSFRGFVSVLMPTITTTLCNLDLTYFPFDEQNCTLAMLEAEFYNVTPRTVSLGDMSKYFGTNAAWKLISHDCYPQTSFESDPPFNFVSCHGKISRRSVFYMVNLIGPMGMTSLMTLIAFCVPAEGGEKVSFIVSMFMSTSVFYNYIINITPPSMEHLPRINILLVGIAVQIIFATAAIVFVLNRYSKARKHQKHHEMRNLHEHINLSEDLTGGNSDKPTPQVNQKTGQTTSFDDKYLADGIKNRSGKLIKVQSDVTKDTEVHLKLQSKNPLRLNCDQLDVLFFCIMFVVSVLLHISVFLV